MNDKLKALLIGTGIALFLGASAITGFFGIGKDKPEDRDDDDGYSYDTYEPPPPPPHLPLACRFDPGTLFTHDLYVTNTCGKDLTEVRVAFTLVGEDASPTAQRYWASWPLGVVQHITYPVDSVSNVQRLELSGGADQGVFDGTVQF